MGKSDYDLRCDNKLHGRVFPSIHVVEFKCNDRKCEHGPGVTVLHRFKYDVEPWELVETLIFRNPPSTKGAR